MAQVNVNLAFNADTGKAKTQIMELQSLLSKIAYTGATSGTDKLQTDLHAASEAAKELQFHLNNAFNASTGNFDLSMLDKSLKTSGSNITDLSVKLLSAGATGQQAFVKLAQSISLADQPMFRISNRMKEFAVTMKNTVKWQLSSSMLHGFMGAVQSAYGYAQDLNESLNNIRIVTGYNIDKMAQFAEQANKAAKALSTTTTDYTDASLIYFQQGLSDAEVQGRTDTTIKLANVTGQSVEETANQMTAIWNNFDNGSKSLDYYADVITALGAATASSSKEISEGLNKFSAIAESVGLSYEYASAALATVTATTRQSADIVGNSFKTLFARIQGLNLGETLDDGTTLNKYSEALFKVGINVKDQSGQLKDMNTILDEMGSKWNTLGKDQQVALAQTVGGVRQYTQLIALMDNWDYFQQNLGVATGAEGTLNKQAEIYAESWEAAEKRVQAAAEGIFQSLIDDKFFISLNNGFANLLGGLDAFIDSAGGVKTVLIGIAGIVSSVFANKIPQVLDNFKYNLEIVTKGTQAAYNRMQTQMAEATQTAFNEYITSGGTKGIKEDSATGYAIQQANELTAARNKLAMVNDKMSTSEKQLADMSLSIIQSRQEEVIALKQKNEAMQKSIELQNKEILQTNIGDKVSQQSSKVLLDDTVEDLKGQKQFYDSSVQQKSGKQQKIYQTEANSFAKALEEIKVFSDQFDARKEEIRANYDELHKIIFEGFQKIQNGDTVQSITSEQLFGELDFQNPKNAVDSMIQSIERLGATATNKNKDTILEAMRDEVGALSSTIPEAIQKATGLKQVFDKIVSKSSVQNLDQMDEAIKNLKDGLKAAKIEGKDFENILKGFHGNKISTLSQAMETLKNNESDAATKAEALQRLLNSFNPGHIVRLSEAFGGLVGFLGSTVTIGNSVKSILMSLGDPDLSGWEKFSSIMMGVTTILPSAKAAFEGLNAVIQGGNQWIATQNLLLGASSGAFGANAAAIEKKTMEEIASYIATQKATGALEEDIIATVAAKLMTKGLAQADAEAAAAAIVHAGGVEFLNGALAKLGALLTWIKGHMLLAIGIAAAVVVAISGIAWIIDQLYTNQKEANEAVAKSTEKYEEQKSKLDELKNELQSVNDQIAELNSQDQLDIVSQAELDKLEARRASLEAQVALQERLAAAAQREQANTISKNWDKSSDLTLQPSQNGVMKGTDWVWTDGDSRPIYIQLVETLDQYQKRVGYNPETGEFDAKRNYTDDQITKMTTFMQQWEIDNQAQIDKQRSDKQKQYLQTEANYDAMVAAAQVGNYTWKQGEKEQMQSDLAEWRKFMYGEDYNDLFIKPLLNAAEQVSIAKGEDGKYSITGISQEEMDLHGISQGELDTWLNDQITANSEDFAKLKSIQDLDFSKLTSDQLFLLFDNLEQLEHFNGSSMEELIAYLTEIQNIEPPEFDVDSWKADYAKKMSIIKNLETGDSISPEDYNLLGDAYQDYFQEQLDGTYLLIGAAEELKAKAQETETEILKEEIKQQQNESTAGAQAYGKAVGKDNVTTDYVTKMANSFMAVARGEAGAGSAEGLIDTKAYKGMMAATGITKEELDGYSTAEEKIQALAQAWLNLQDSLNEDQNTLADSATTVDELVSITTQGLAQLEDTQQSIDSVIMKEAKIEDLDPDTILNLAKAYEDLIEVEEEAGETTEDVQKMSKRLALANQKTQKGIDNLAEGWEDWNETLKVGNKESKAYNDAISGIEDTLSDMLGISMDDLSEGFAESAYEAGLLERIVQGDLTALDELRQMAAQDIIMKADLDYSKVEGGKDAIDAMIQELVDNPPTIGASLDSSEFASSLLDMLNQTGMTVDQMQALFDALGYEPVIDYIEIPANSASESQLAQAVSVYDPLSGEWKEGTVESQGGIAEGTMIRVPVINGSKTKYTGGGAGGGYTPPKSSGGGGGGGSAPKHAEKKNDSDKERYHTLQNQLEDLQSEYDAISEAKDRAFGRDKLNNIDKEIQKTNELIDKQKEYIDAISADLPVDKGVMDAYYTDLIGGIIEYDKRGNISNYDQIQDAMFAKYNQMADRYDEDSEEWQIFEKKYEQLEKYIEQYEETYDLLRDEEETYQELLRQRMDLQLEKIQYAIELKLNIAEDGLAVLEYQMGKIEDNAFKAAEAIGLFSKKAELLYDQMVADREGLNDILGQQLSQAEIIQFYNGDISVLEGKTFTEDQIDAIKDYRDNLLDLNEEFDDIRENIEEQVMEVFDAWNEKLEQGIDKLDHYGNVLESYKNIIDIVGKDTLGLSDAFMATLNQFSIDNAINKVTATKKSYETMIDAQSQAEQALEEAKARNDEASIKMWEENLQSITEEAQSAREEMLSAWEDALDGIAEQFEATVERVVDIFNKEIYTLGGLEGLSEDFSRQQENADIMLDDYQKIYELSKLSRDINKSIDDTDSISGKQKLKKLLEQINKLQEDGVEMSQYDLEYMQKTYDLRLAEIELEEAQRAKNTVRLRKDNEGNWSYVYTQNMDAVDTAQQKYEDALYAMQDVSSNYIDEMSEKLISTSKEMEEALAAIRIQDYANIDDYYAEVQRVQKQYEDELAIQQKELQKAIDNNKILYDEDWTNYHNATGYKISDTENFATTFRDTLLGSLMGSEEDTANFTDIISSAVNTLTQGLMQGAEVYYANLQDAMNAAGTSTEDFAKDFEEKIKEIEDKSEESTNKIKDLAKDMSSSLKDITDSAITWQETYGEVMQQIINSNLDVINSFNDMLEALSIDKNSITVKYDILNDDTKKPEQYASGGYTGKWGNYGKLAILDEKELILNKDDTVNFLDALGIAKQIIDTIDLNALQASYGFGNLVPATINENNSQTIEQDVHITAEFPNATDHNEIEQAFETLINKASQYANRK